VPTVGEGTGDAAIEGLGLGLGVPDGRILGDVEAAGVALAATVADAAGVGLAFATVGDGLEAAGVGLAALAVGAAVVPGVGVGLVLATDGEGLAATVGLAVAGVGLAVVAAGVVDPAGAVVVAGVADAVASTGFTNFLGGAFGGGVASALNLVRARSAADRSLISDQPLSTLTSVTRSRTRRGRRIFRTSVRMGTDTSSSPPLTRAWASIFRCRRSR